VNRSIQCTWLCTAHKTNISVNIHNHCVRNFHCIPVCFKTISLIINTHTHTHTRARARAFNGPFPGLSGWAGTRKVKAIWILLKQETVSGSSISWAICKSASRSRQTTTPAPHHPVFTGRIPFLPPNQQRQRPTEQDNPSTIFHRHWLTDVEIRCGSDAFSRRLSNTGVQHHCRRWW